jgi:hypothetical protein
MELGCYLTKELYVSLGMMESTVKRLRTIAKAKRNHAKAKRTTEEENMKKTAHPRRPRAHGLPRPRAHGMWQNYWRPRAHGLPRPRAHGMWQNYWTPRVHGLQDPVRTGLARCSTPCARALYRAHGTPCARGLLSPCARPLPASWLCVTVLPPLRPLPPTYYIFRGETIC